MEQRELPGVDMAPGEMKEKVIPWLEEVSKENKTLRFWTTFLLVDMPAYLAIRFGVRSSDFKPRNAGIRFSLLSSQALAKTGTKGWPSTT